MNDFAGKRSRCLRVRFAMIRMTSDWSSEGVWDEYKNLGNMDYLRNAISIDILANSKPESEIASSSCN